MIRVLRDIVLHREIALGPEVVPGRGTTEIDADQPTPGRTLVLCHLGGPKDLCLPAVGRARPKSGTPTRCTV